MTFQHKIKIPTVAWQNRAHSNKDNNIFGAFETPISWRLYELSGIEDIEVFQAKRRTDEK